MKPNTRKGLFRLYLVGWGGWAAYLRASPLWLRKVLEQGGFEPDRGPWNLAPFRFAGKEAGLLTVFAMEGVFVPTVLLVALRPFVDRE